MSPLVAGRSRTSAPCRIVTLDNLRPAAPRSVSLSALPLRSTARLHRITSICPKVCLSGSRAGVTVEADHVQRDSEFAVGGTTKARAARAVESGGDGVVGGDALLAAG